MVAVLLVPAIIIDGGEGGWSTAAVIVSGVLAAGFGQWLHVTQETKHRIMWLPVRWFGLVFLLLGLIFLIGEPPAEGAMLS